MQTPVGEISPLAVAAIELVPLTATAFYYAHRSMVLSWSGRPVPAWRQTCFWAGYFLICLMLFNPWGYLADELVIAHMIEHLAIGDIASLLIVLGLTRSMLQPILSIRLFNRLRFLANPYFAYPFWTVNLFFWHIPGIYDSAYGGAAVHGIEHAMFLFFGCLMWMPVFGPLPTPTWFGAGWKIVYTVAVRFTAAVLGNFLMWSQFVLYENYAEGQAKWGISAVADQSTAGVIMMVEGTFLILGVLTWTFFDASKRGIRKQELLDLAFERGVPLENRRAELAVRSGYADLLEQKIRRATQTEVLDD